MPRFLVLHRWSPSTVEEYFEHDSPEERQREMQCLYQIGDYLYDHAGTALRPHLYKTIKNASKVARDPDAFMAHGGKPQRNVRSLSKILIFDPTRLLEVTEDELIDSDSRDRDDDVVIAERQIQLWSERLVALQRSK